METLYLRPLYLPEVLRQKERWLPWRRDGRHKVPLDRRGRPCDADDDRHWQSFQEAVRPYYQERRGIAGIGFALRGSGVAVLDLDRVVAPNGRIAPETRRLLAAFNSFSELSPSAAGLHLLIEDELPGGNRRLPGVDLLGSGFVTVTGHPILPGPIQSGGEPWRRLLRRLPPSAPGRAASPALPLAVPAMCEAVLALALGNPRCRRLWHGDWSAYPSRSEADAALAMHLARNGGDLATIVALLHASALPRDPRRDERYLVRTALFALASVVVRIPRIHGVPMPAPERDQENQRRAQLATLLEEHPILGPDARLLLRLAAHLASRREHGEAPDEGYWRISPQMLSGDHPARPGLPPPDRIMSRRGCAKALDRLAERGIVELRDGIGAITWRDAQRKRTRVGAVSLIRVEGISFGEIVTGFLRRADAAIAPPV
jgi:hypothetical protein